MARLRIVTAEDDVNQGVIEALILRRFASHLRAEARENLLDKQCPALWYLQIPEGYDWTEADAHFMNDLVEKQDLLAGWNYQDWW
jgi:hypothetical protein